MESLFTPWRYSYVSNPSRDAACFFCRASDDADDPERLVVHLTQHHLVMLNRHPYTNGHVMVAPRLHVANPLESSPEALGEFWPLVLRTERVLLEAYHPDGLNMGMNLGRTAGAGVPGHFHFHLVPRWEADTNFMGVVAGVRVVPESLYDSWRRLRELFQQENGDAGGAGGPGVSGRSG